MTTEPGDAEIRWLRPSHLLLRARRIQTALVTVPVAAVGGVIAGTAGSAALGLGIGLGLVVVGLLCERFFARRVAAWGYAERRDDLMVKRGDDPPPVGHSVRADADRRRHRGPDRAEPRPGHAADAYRRTAASDARIPGLDKANAAKLRDQLASLGESQAAGL